MISTLPKWAADLTERAGSIMIEMRILDIVHINQNIKKIRFIGNLSRMNFEIGYANVIRVSNTEFRNYTTAHHNLQKGILDIIFHIHGNGVGSRYIDTLKTEDQLRISIPRGKSFYDPNVKQQLIFGDETSLGLACSLLPLLELNKHEYQFYFELDEDNAEVPKLLGLKNYAVFPKKNAFQNEHWIKGLQDMKSFDGQEGNIILTGNVKSVQTLRKILKGKTSGKIYSQGYWLEGKKGL